MKDLNQVLLNPVRSRIIQYLATHNTATAGELDAVFTDVPRTTLYRHMKVLAEHEVITVVAENRIRCSLERTYALNLAAVTEQNTVENATRNAFGFLMKIYADFSTYFGDKDVDPTQDRIFLGNVSLLLSDAEFDDVLQQINALLRQHLNNTPSPERRPRSISVISSPTIEGKAIKQ